MYDWMAWLEGSALAAWLRGLGIWTYGLLNLGHILGIATLFGSVLVMYMRLLGAWRRVPPVHLIRPTVPLAAAGFVLAAVTGISMLSFNATDYHGNPFLYVKLPVIVAALINVAIVQRLAAWRRAAAGAPAARNDRLVLAVVGAVSLVLWTTVIACGRMIGYW
jgi:hypothetical protein